MIDYLTNLFHVHNIINSPCIKIWDFSRYDSKKATIDDLTTLFHIHSIINLVYLEQLGIVFFLCIHKIEF